MSEFCNCGHEVVWQNGYRVHTSNRRPGPTGPCAMSEACATVRCSHPARTPRVADTCNTVGCASSARLTVMSQEGRWEWLDRFCTPCAVRFVSEGAARWLTMEERGQAA